jgi:hypothetical protein
MSLKESRFANPKNIKLDDLHIDERWIGQEIQSIFDKYAYSYNAKEEKNKISYTANLINLYVGYAKKAQNLNKGIKSQKQALYWQIETINQSLWDRKFNDKKLSQQEEVIKAVNVVKGSIDPLVFILKEGVDCVSDELNGVKESYKKLFATLDNSDRFHPKHFLHLQRLFDKCVKYSKWILHIRALNELTEEMALHGYPEEIAVFEKLTADQKAKLRETKYGPHQANATWVHDRYWELEQQSDQSQNKRGGQIQHEYQNKFGLSISKSQIYRFAGVVNN